MSENGTALESDLPKIQHHKEKKYIHNIDLARELAETTQSYLEEKYPNEPIGTGKRSRIAQRQATRVAIKEAEKKLKEEQEKLSDTLTGILNRRGLETSANQALAHAQRAQENLIIAMLDLDHFKKINDTFGHDIGDKVLIEFTKLVQTELREADILGTIRRRRIYGNTSRDKS